MNKQFYFDATKEVLLKKIQVIENALQETQSSANSDTKSSAGDKHETSRAMAHLVNERLAGQLSVLQDQIEVLNKINTKIESNKASFGSVVDCDKSCFFISTGLGKIKKENNTFYAIASNSPVGNNLIGKVVGDEIKVGNENQLIYNIY